MPSDQAHKAVNHSIHAALVLISLIASLTVNLSNIQTCGPRILHLPDNRLYEISIPRNIQGKTIC